MTVHELIRQLVEFDKYDLEVLMDDDVAQIFNIERVEYDGEHIILKRDWNER